jgi:hypothetical protein
MQLWIKVLGDERALMAEVESEKMWMQGRSWSRAYIVSRVLRIP